MRYLIWKEYNSKEEDNPFQIERRTILRINPFLFVLLRGIDAEGYDRNLLYVD